MNSRAAAHAARISSAVLRGLLMQNAPHGDGKRKLHNAAADQRPRIRERAFGARPLALVLGEPFHPVAGDPGSHPEPGAAEVVAEESGRIDITDALVQSC